MFSPAIQLIFPGICTLLTATLPYIPSSFEEFSGPLQIGSGGTTYFVPEVCKHDLPPCFRLHKQHPSLPKGYCNNPFVLVDKKSSH